MQGKKDYQEKLYMSFQLSDRIPADNFYRRLKEALGFNFLYKLTKQYYGIEGQKSIDPVVFFKLCLVGYLENIISDRSLMNHCSMRMDILFFLNYDVDEPLPWYSTLSRTRNLFPNELFEQVFDRVLSMCVDKCMVSGHTQVIDSAPVKANASMDSLELKVPAEDLQSHLEKVRVMSNMDRPVRKAKENKAPEEQRKVTATDRELKEIKSRNKKWSKDQDQRPGAKNKGSKYTSNKTHYSPTDPDARISVKPGKPRQLNYTSHVAVDSSHHVITHIEADYANKKDSQNLQQLTGKLKSRLHKNGLLWRNLPADAGYSSGENYAYLEEQGLKSYIPPHGTYKGGPEGFTYHKEGDYWECPQGEHVTFRKTYTERKNQIKKKLYLTKSSQCKGCPIKQQCIGKLAERRITITYYKEEYDRAIARINSQHGKRMKKLRQSTVEPVFGTLINFMGMRKVYTRGIQNASKVMLMAAMAYNLKKYLKFTKNKVETMVNQVENTMSLLFGSTSAKLSSAKPIIFSVHPTCS